VLAQLEEATPDTMIDIPRQIANRLRCHACDLLKATDVTGKQIRPGFTENTPGTSARLEAPGRAFPISNGLR
jgi:hypothetical protein